MNSGPVLADFGSSPLERSPAAVRDQTDRAYVAMGLLLLAIVATAFSQRYFGRAFTDATPLPLFVHVHALLFITWIVLFTVQANLAQRGLFQYHRPLGMGSMGLAAVIVIVGVYSAIEGGRRGHNPGGAPNALVFMIVGLADIALFAAFVTAGWFLRKQRDLHKRMMLFATLGGFLWPAITRLPFATGRFPIMLACFAAVLIAPAIATWVIRRRIHPFDIVCALLVLASLPLRRAIGTTEAWQRLAAWLVG